MQENDEKIAFKYEFSFIVIHENAWGWALPLAWSILGYTCGFVLTCMQTEEIEMHASAKIIVVTGFTTELHAG